MNIQKLFKPYFVTRKKGQSQVLIPLVELDDLCDKIDAEHTAIERLKSYQKGMARGVKGERKRIASELRRWGKPYIEGVESPPHIILNAAASRIEREARGAKEY